MSPSLPMIFAAFPNRTCFLRPLSIQPKVPRGKKPHTVPRYYPKGRILRWLHPRNCRTHLQPPCHYHTAYYCGSYFGNFPYLFEPLQKQQEPRHSACGGMAGWCSYLRFNRELINHPIEVLHDQHDVVEVDVLIAVYVPPFNLINAERYLAIYIHHN